MMFVIVFVSAVVLAAAQRSTYVGPGPVGRPGLAQRFRDTETETTTETDLANRLGESSTQKIPVDARGDADLVNRLQQWPRENQPFWLLNAEHIEAHRNPQPGSFQSRTGAQDSIPVRPPQLRSSFLRPLRR